MQYKRTMTSIENDPLSTKSPKNKYLNKLVEGIVNKLAF